MARITEDFHYGTDRTTTTVELAGDHATAAEVEALVRKGGYNLNAADQQVKMLRTAQLLNTYGKAELGWARYSLTR